MGRSPPYATTVALALMGLMAWKVTGFVPTEESLRGVWFSQQAMLEGEWYRLLTSIFAHGGIIHLAFNAIAILSLVQLEDELGSLAYAGVFLASGIGGNIAHAMTTTTPAVGASGAIFGLLGILLALAPWTRLSLLGLPVPAVLLLPGYAALVLLVPGLQELAPIAHFAHLGGLVVGLAAGVGLDPPRALDHLAYAAVAFVGVGVMVLNMQAVGIEALVAAIQRDGLVGLIELAWPSLVGLAILAGVLYALPDDEPEPAPKTGARAREG